MIRDKQTKTWYPLSLLASTIQPVPSSTSCYCSVSVAMGFYETSSLNVLLPTLCHSSSFSFCLQIFNVPPLSSNQGRMTSSCLSSTSLVSSIGEACATPDSRLFLTSASASLVIAWFSCARGERLTVVSHYPLFVVYHLWQHCTSSFISGTCVHDV